MHSNHYVLRKSFEGFSAGTRVYLETELKDGAEKVSVMAWCDPNYMFEVPVTDIVKLRKRVE